MLISVSGCSTPSTLELVSITWKKDFQLYPVLKPISLAKILHIDP
jgi:hypothetical protein